jgi:4-aminobutyrate aminotransferase/diaminobutyrate-pyruvate transaminase/4-aminobutyrate aminotransferase/(S)-3-amino-2-methylpropionate transaminase
MAHKYNLTPVSVKPVDTKYRKIVTKIPVPESLAIFDRLNKYEPVSMSGQPPIIWHKAEGLNVYDKWGNKWLDWSSGVLITNSGHAHPRICSAVQAMLDQKLLATYVFPHEGRAELCERLSKKSPDGTYKVFLLTTGSEACENAIKLARTYGTRKHGKRKYVFVSFETGFHGRTMGVQMAGGNPALKEWITEPAPGFVQVPFPDGFRTEDNRFEVFEKTLAKQGVTPDQVCGVMFESYQGAGPNFMPVEYAQALEAWCRKHDVVLITDEVQSGFGRTGKFFCFQHYGIKPDLITCGKGLSSSLPIAAVIGRSDIMDLYPPGSMTSTHSASPLPVASAIANLQVLDDEKLTEKAAALEPILKKALEGLKARYPKNIGFVPCKGLVAGMLMVKPGTKDPDADTAMMINEKCFQKGLLMFAPVGVGGACVKIAPPLTIPLEALEEGIAVLEEACAEVLGK